MESRIIQFKRGGSNSFSAVELAPGEPAFLLDTGELYIGDGTNKVRISLSEEEVTTIVDTVLEAYVNTELQSAIDTRIQSFATGDLINIIDERIDLNCKCNGTATSYTYYLLTNGNSDIPALLFIDGDIIVLLDGNASNDYDTPITNGVDELLFANGDVIMSGPNYDFEYITNGNIDIPELLFVNGDILEMEVA